MAAVMIIENEEQIEQFINYFNEEIKKVSIINNRLYCKILFSCMIDALATARFPKHNTNEKIISFLLNCSKSPELNRVSLVQLQFFLNYTLSDKEKVSSQLLQFVLQETSKMKDGNVYKGYDIDSYYNQLDVKATFKEKKILKLARYANLFYEYRNEMIHGFKKSGYGMEMSYDAPSPYYHSYINKPWQLVFPISFFKMICTDALAGLKKYLIDKNVNPYDQYEFGDMWVKRRKLDKIRRPNK
jgi:hypothetical protein